MPAVFGDIRHLAEAAPPRIGVVLNVGAAHIGEFGSVEGTEVHAKEMLAYERAGVTRLHTVFSRVPGQPKQYVQQAIAEQSDEVWRLIQHGAIVYVCGDATRMAPDVRRAFGAIFQAQTGTTEADADAWLHGLQAANRYLEDIWGGSGA